MIPGINTFFNKFNDKKSSKVGKKKDSLNFLHSEEVPRNDFEEFFHHILPQQVLEEFASYEPDNLIDKIVFSGKKYRNGRKKEDLATYKYYLSGFLALCLDKSYRLGFIKKKGLSNEDFEDKLILIVEIKKKYTALTEYLLN